MIRIAICFSGKPNFYKSSTKCSLLSTQKINISLASLLSQIYFLKMNTTLNEQLRIIIIIRISVLQQIPLNAVRYSNAKTHVKTSIAHEHTASQDDIVHVRATLP